MDVLVLQTLVFYGLFFIAGLLLKFSPPKRINKWYGYRTPKAMKDDASWSFAQNYSSQLILIYTPIFCSLSLLTKYLSNFNYSAAGLYILIDILLLIIITVLIYFITESKLHRRAKSQL